MRLEVDSGSTYRIEATSVSEGGGRFQLLVSYVRCVAIQPRRSEDPLSGTKFLGDSSPPCFELPVTDPNDTLWIEMESDEFDSYLKVYQGSRLVASDDDSGIGLNAQLHLVGVADTLRIYASSYSGAGIGRFTLDVMSTSESRKPATQWEVIDRLYVEKGRRVFCEVDTLPLDNAELDRDPLHPSHFVQIFERTSDGDFLPLFKNLYSGSESTDESEADSTDDSAADATARPILRAGYDVDERSSIVVRFDRGHLKSHGGRFNLAIDITATINTGGETPPVEVLGYQELGQSRRRAGVSIAAATDLIGQLCDVAAHDLYGVQKFARLWGEIPGPDEFDTEMQRDEWIVKYAEIASSSLATLTSWDVALARLVSLEDARLEPLTSFAKTTPAALKARIAQMKSATDILRGFERTNASTDAELAKSAIYNLSLALPLLDDFLDRLDNDLGETQTRKHGTNPTTKLMGRLLSNLREAEIPLLAQGIGNGSIVTVTISNAVNGGDAPRAMRLQFVVRRFGVSDGPTIRDSFLFLNRLGVPDGNQENADGAEASVPLPASALPTAGTSAFWSVYPRGTGFARFVRFFEPGFGVNVSFPQFGTRITSHKSVTDGAGREVTISESDHSMGLGVGLLVLLRGGLVQFTLGKNLSVNKNPWYWGLGFSFIKIGQELGAKK